MLVFLKDVAHCVFKGRYIEVKRDINGKFLIEVDGKFVQKGLVASEAIGWFCNIINDVDK